MRFALIAQHALADAGCPIERQMCQCRSAFVPLGSSEIGILILFNVTAIICWPVSFALQAIGPT
jgi:hypothetical protein